MTPTVRLFSRRHVDLCRHASAICAVPSPGCPR
ncbi:putative leader peptide [Streptomyces sp. NPDC059957]